MTPITINLKYGPMLITVEPVGNQFQRVSRYNLSNHPKLTGKTFTNKGKLYKRESSAIKDAQAYAANQKSI